MKEEDRAREALQRIANYSGGTDYSTIHGMRGIAKDALAAFATPSPVIETEGSGERVCANCKGMIGDLAAGRDPEELCETCYEDSQALAQPAESANCPVGGEASADRDAVEQCARIVERAEIAPIIKQRLIAEFATLAQPNQPPAVQIPEGMKPWHGGESAPEDWDGNSVLLADGEYLAVDPNDSFDWSHEGGELGCLECWCITAYTPKANCPVGGEAGCAARRSWLPEPQDCDWPHCGCDPHAGRVVEALIEEGWVAPALPPANAGYSVSGTVYEAAVKGRQDFRQAYRELLPIQRAAAALCLLWRSPQHPFQVSDEFADAVNALDVATCGGGKSGAAIPALKALADPVESAERGAVERIARGAMNQAWGANPRRFEEIVQETTSAILAALPPAGAGDVGYARGVEDGETWESINRWCDDTFGLATVPQIIARAKEEFDELETPGANHAIEAADVVICLCRIPGFAEALQAKMAINRKRKWRLVGNGTGYHIPEDSALSARKDAAIEGGER